MTGAPPKAALSCPDLAALPHTVSARLVAMLGPARMDLAPLVATNMEVAARLLEGCVQLVQEIHLPAAQQLSRVVRWGVAEEVALHWLRSWQDFSWRLRIAFGAASLGFASSLSLGEALSTAHTVKARQQFVTTIAGA